MTRPKRLRSPRKPATPWERAVGRSVKRPRSRWRRWRLKREAREGERRSDCRYCRASYTSDRVLDAHVQRCHRPEWLRDELYQLERKASWGRHIPASDDRAWAYHPIARRYRRLLKRWWALDTAEYTQARTGVWPWPERYLTRLESPGTGYQVPGTGTASWDRQVAKFWPEQWAVIQAKRAEQAGG